MKAATIALVCFLFLLSGVKAQLASFAPGETWPDEDGTHINAHGGGILCHEGVYYWFGEHKGEAKADGNTALVGVNCYSSSDLYNWTKEGVALSVHAAGSGSDIESGCIIERPKVIYNKKTDTFVMYFHLELKGQGYDAARAGIATAKSATGPYEYRRSLRPNAGRLPASHQDGTPFYFDIYLLRDYETGHKSRDMTLFVDDDAKAYHIFSSEDNATLHVAELTDDYLDYTGIYERVAPGGYNEAPAVFKQGNKYYMIASGCTGWNPNPARLFVADHIMGPWRQYANPCVGTNADKTFQSQSAFVFPVQGKKSAYIFMADRWKPNTPIDGRYVWLPIQFENGLPVLKWQAEWNLDSFSGTYQDLQTDIRLGKELLNNIQVGEQVGEFPQEACDDFEQALRLAETLPDNASADELEDAIIALSNAAATFQYQRHPRELDTLENGDYYIKVGGKYFTNSLTIDNNSPVDLREEKNVGTVDQVFTISKHPDTGRYMIVSKLDGRNLNEDARLRTGWGANDHLWRTMHFIYNGSSYAIHNDGKTGYGGLWKLKNGIVKSTGEWITYDNDGDFQFTLEKWDEETAVYPQVSDATRCFARAGHLVIDTNVPVRMMVYHADGRLHIGPTEIRHTETFPLLPGMYIVRLTSTGHHKYHKVIIN